MSAKVNGLGHIGFYVKDLDLMKDFYANFLGMTLTKVSPASAFFSADPEGVDHEIALINGRNSVEDPNWIQQISMRVDSLDDLRDTGPFYSRIFFERNLAVAKNVFRINAKG